MSDSDLPIRAIQSSSPRLRRSPGSTCTLPSTAPSTSTRSTMCELWPHWLTCPPRRQGSLAILGFFDYDDIMICSLNQIHNAG